MRGMHQRDGSDWATVAYVSTLGSLWPTRPRVEFDGTHNRSRWRLRRSRQRACTPYSRSNGGPSVIATPRRRLRAVPGFP